MRAAGPLGLRLRAPRSLLVIVDVQERLVPAVADAERVLRGCEALLRAARRLGVPALLTEHCPQQLGPLLPALRGLGAADSVLAKTHFSAADEPAVAQRVAAANRPQIVIAGMEAHVCVLQTALGLRQAGYAVKWVADAIGSRHAHNRVAATERARGLGADIVTTEMVIFEWLGTSEHPKFRRLSGLIR